MVMFDTVMPTPQSLIKMNLLFVSGATRSNATSLKYACDKPFIRTLRSVTVPLTPVTVMFDGYGVAGAVSLMVIGAILLKVVVVCANAATVKTANIKIKLLKKVDTFIFLLEKLK